MPLPTPKKDEKKDDFISRCIKTITEEERDRFPSREQRAAICYSQWGETPAEKEAAHRKKAAREKQKA